jgi:integrase
LPKPWFRKSKKAWYLQVSRGVQRCLGKSKAEADAAYREWLLEQGEPLPRQDQQKLTVAEIAQEFLDDSKANNDPRTYEFYLYFVVPFVKRFGAARAACFPPLSFQKWLNENKGWQASRRNAVVAIRRLFNWALKHKLIPENPILSVEKPSKRRRKRFMAAPEEEFVYSAIRDEQFREFVFAMLETGCRPGEVMSVTADHVSADGKMWSFDKHKTDRDGEAREIHLTEPMQELTKKLVALYPEGPLFRMFRGKKADKDKYNRAVLGARVPWTYNAIRCRFKRLREKYPELKGLTSYVLRHTYTTRALLNGVPVPLVSALLGHKSIRMVDEVYNQTPQAKEHIKEASRKATCRA